MRRFLNSCATIRVVAHQLSKVLASLLCTAATLAALVLAVHHARLAVELLLS